MAESTQTEDLYEVHLSGKGMSRRAVRYRVLSYDQVEHIELQAAKTVTPDTTRLELDIEVITLGLRAMVAEVSDPIVPDDYKKDRSKVSWKKVDAAALEQGWKGYFNARDTGALKKIYLTEHVVTGDEVDSILAGKVPVVAD